MFSWKRLRNSAEGNVPAIAAPEKGRRRGRSALRAACLQTAPLRIADALHPLSAAEEWCGRAGVSILHLAAVARRPPPAPPAGAPLACWWLRCSLLAFCHQLLVTLSLRSAIHRTRFSVNARVAASPSAVDDPALAVAQSSLRASDGAVRELGEHQGQIRRWTLCRSGRHGRRRWVGGRRGIQR